MYACVTLICLSAALALGLGGMRGTDRNAALDPARTAAALPAVTDAAARTDAAGVPSASPEAGADADPLADPEAGEIATAHTSADAAALPAAGVDAAALPAAGVDAAALPAAGADAAALPATGADAAALPATGADAAALPAANADAVTILISAAGDCTLGGDTNSSAGKRFQTYAAKYGADYFLANVRDILLADDFTVVNLEGPLTTQTSKRSGRIFNFRGRPEFAQILSGSGVEVCSLANNHALDFKAAGLTETAQTLHAAGIGAAGYENACYAEKDGVRLCFLSFTEWDFSEAEIAERVAAERAACDLVIVSMHWGEELRYRATGVQTSYGRAIIDAGADLVLGHHSHVVGGIEKYRGKYILYSLGNFCFGGNSNPSDKDTFIFQQTFVFRAGSGVEDGGINVIPCSISSAASTNNYQPTPLSGGEAREVVRKIASYSPVAADEILWMDAFIGNA